MKVLIKAVWHLIRYIVATCISIVVSGLLPLLAASIPIFMAVAWVLVWALDFVVYSLTGESMLQGVLVDDPFGIVLVPLMFGGIGAFAVSAISLVVVAFNVLIVLPVSLATDLVCQRLSVRSVVPRLGGFLLSGLLLGIAITSIVMILFGFYHPDIPASVLFGSGLVVLLICVCIVFVFGLALTMLSAFKNKIVRLKIRLGQRKLAATAPDELRSFSPTTENCA